MPRILKLHDNDTHIFVLMTICQKNEAQVRTSNSIRRHQKLRPNSGLLHSSRQAVLHHRFYNTPSTCLFSFSAFIHTYTYLCTAFYYNYYSSISITLLLTIPAHFVVDTP